MIDGVRAVAFTLFTEASEGEGVWTEEHTSVTVTRGLFNVILGTVNTDTLGEVFQEHNKLYLEMEVSGETLSPRQRLASVGYALNAHTADTVKDGAISSDKVALGFGLVPTGTIVMWSGAGDAIPSGWALCDGTEGTPDLRDRFIVGAGSTYAVNSRGGANNVTLSINQMPSHTHLQNAHNHSQQPHGHYVMPFSNSGGAIWASHPSPGRASNGSADYSIYMGVTLSATATNDPATAVNQSTGEGQGHENRPPYHALCYIMKL